MPEQFHAKIFANKTKTNTKIITLYLPLVGRGTLQLSERIRLLLRSVKQTHPIENNIYI